MERMDDSDSDEEEAAGDKEKEKEERFGSELPQTERAAKDDEPLTVRRL